MLSKIYSSQDSLKSFTLPHEDAIFIWDQTCNAVSSVGFINNYTSLLCQSFCFETDTSIAGLGAVLAQEQGNEVVAPNAFATCTLRKEKSFGVTELEALRNKALYTIGNTCDIFTDHEALKS